MLVRVNDYTELVVLTIEYHLLILYKILVDKVDLSYGVKKKKGKGKSGMHDWKGLCTTARIR